MLEVGWWVYRLGMCLAANKQRRQLRISWDIAAFCSVFNKCWSYQPKFNGLKMLSGTQVSLAFTGCMLAFILMDATRLLHFQAPLLYSIEEGRVMMEELWITEPSKSVPFYWESKAFLKVLQKESNFCVRTGPAGRQTGRWGLRIRNTKHQVKKQFTEGWGRDK